MASGDGDGQGGSRKGARYWIRAILRFFGIACATFFTLALVYPAFDLVLHVPVHDWSVDSYWRAIENERNITLAATISITLAGGGPAIIALVRKIGWHLDFPARFRDRIHELDRDPPEPKSQD